MAEKTMNKKIENAVALLYNKEIHHAPVVISKGSNFLAKRMVDIAKKIKCLLFQMRKQLIV